MIKSLAIYVSSCDKYSWLLPAFFYFFRKYWPDCPYETYLGTETIAPQKEGIKVLTSGKGVMWGENTQLNLAQIREDYILWLQDDYFLTKKIRTKDIGKALDLLISMKGKYLRLYVDPDLRRRGMKKEDKERKVFEISDDYFYICSLQSAIWERKFLLSIIDKSETIWDFEMHANDKLLPRGAFYALNKSLINYEFGGAMQKGRLLRKYYNFFVRNNMEVNDESVMSVLEDIKWHLTMNPFNPNFNFLIGRFKTFWKTIKQ